MKFKILDTGSKGNLYLLTSNTNKTLIIEAGIKLKEVLVETNFDLASIEGMIVTHEHGDHFKFINEYIKANVKIYGSNGTFKNYNDHNIFKIKHGQVVEIGEFKVQCFNTVHDANEPLGFIIFHKECGNVLFMTDTKYSGYKFNNLNQIIMEANYCEEILDKKYYDISIPAFLYKRIIKSHMSIQTCVKFLVNNDISKVENIVLIHLSDSNSNEQEFKNRVIEAIGRKPIIADKRKVIDFNINPY